MVTLNEKAWFGRGCVDRSRSAVSPCGSAKAEWESSSPRCCQTAPVQKALENLLYPLSTESREGKSKGIILATGHSPLDPACLTTHAGVWILTGFSMKRSVNRSVRERPIKTESDPLSSFSLKRKKLARPGRQAMIPYPDGSLTDMVQMELLVGSLQNPN